MAWVGETPMARVRLIGVLEIAGAIGIVVPWATGILTPLTHTARRLGPRSPSGGRDLDAHEPG
jgi:hypothetical protein